MAKIVFITGANTGIGVEMVRALYSSSRGPYQILMGSRSLKKAETAIARINSEFPSSKSTILPIQIDIESDASIHGAQVEIETKFGKLDVLINNAGAQFELQFQAGKISERELWTKSWDINVAGTQIVTTAFVPLLLKSSDPRLLFVTSGTATLKGTENLEFALNKSPGPGWPKPSLAELPAYRSAKTGLNMLMREWHRRLREDGVKVWAISPGFLATGLGGDPENLKKFGAPGDPAVAGPFVRSIVEGQRDEDCGKILTRGGIQGW